MTTEAPKPRIRISILHVPDCPLVHRLIERLEECMDTTGVRHLVEVSVGPHPSPTLVIDGLDVATGRPVAGDEQCRLDLPTRDQILAALAHID